MAEQSVYRLSPPQRCKRQKHVSKSVHVEAALFGEDIESILKLILKFAILAKPNQQNKSVNNQNKNTSKL